MSFILDVDKNNPILEANIINSVLNVDTNNDIITIGSTGSNSIELNGGVKFNYKKITTAGTTYFLTQNDYFVEIDNPSYNSVVLPQALTGSGISYIISRSNNNTNNDFRIQAQIGDDIDDRDHIILRKSGNHIKVISNGENTWHVI